MKCRRILVLILHASDESPPWSGYGDNMLPELTEGAAALRRRYSQIDVSGSAGKVEIKSIQVIANECDGVSDAGYDYLLPSPAMRDEASAFGGQAGLGLYLLMHGTEHSFSGALDGATVAGFVNALGVVPKKICVVACNAARDQADLMLDFCRALKIDPKPVVAGYHYPVHLRDDGRKLFQPLRQSAAEPKIAKSELTAGQLKSYKKYFQFSDGIWKRTTRNVYHDEHF